jgi:RND family efflux transporter MFP subunit
MALAFFLPDYFSFVQASDESIYRVEPAAKEIVLTGYTRSKNTMVISSEVSGKIISVNYEVGDTIGKEPVVEVDSTFVNFQIQSLRRSFQLLENNLKKANEQVKFFEKEFSRMDKLYKENSASGIKRDAAEQEFIQARLQRDHAAIEKSKVEVSLNEALELKKRHMIFAPFGWKVVDKTVEIGEHVIQGAPLARASDFRTLAVPLSVSGEELEAIRALPLEFSANLEQENIKAIIRWVNPEFDEKTRKLRIELLIAQYTGEKRGGLRFKLPLKIPSHGIQIPKAALVDRYENPRVKIKATGEMINVSVLGENDGNLIIVEDPRLPSGTILAGSSEAQ